MKKYHRTELGVVSVPVFPRTDRFPYALWVHIRNQIPVVTYATYAAERMGADAVKSIVASHIAAMELSTTDTASSTLSTLVVLFIFLQCRSKSVKKQY